MERIWKKEDVIFTEQVGDLFRVWVGLHPAPLAIYEEAGYEVLPSKKEGNFVLLKEGKAVARLRQVIQPCHVAGCNCPQDEEGIPEGEGCVEDVVHYVLPL